MLLPTICLKFILLLFVAKSSLATVYIQPNLLKSLENKQLANIFITMKEGTQEVLEAASIATNSYKDRGEKITAIQHNLNQHADVSQAPILELLNKSTKISTTNIKSFWITNQIYIKNADLSIIELLKDRQDISKIEEERIIQLDEPIVQFAEVDNPESAQWGVVLIKAPQVWNMNGGSNGSGVVVGITDTGVRGSHQALASNYKNDGFSWYDPYHGSRIPNDGDGHGTHVAGTVCGLNGIGVAPGAKWVACKGLNDDGTGTASALIDCGQFMLCPTDYTGASRDCSKAPDLVSNSWGGGQGQTWFNDVILAWHVAGIIPIFANGNSGPVCDSVNSPGDHDDVISVGATTISDSLATFSSVGPTVYGTVKPNICAPGYLIVSASISGDAGYTSMSGTSMACPHVSGLVALLLGRYPDLGYTSIKSILEETADRDLLFYTKSCGDIRDSDFPNNHFGHGRINAYKAIIKAGDYSSGNFVGPSSIMFLLSIAIGTIRSHLL